MCTFGLQTVVCGNITGNESDPVSINFYTTEQTRASTGILHLTDSQVIHNSDSTEMLDNHNSDTNIVYTISTSSLVAALIVSTVVFITVIVIISIRSKAKIKAAREQSHRAEGTINDEPTYEDVTDEPMYEDVTGPSPSVNIINTQDSVAYGHAQTTTTT